jgi:hypothetical protein
MKPSETDIAPRPWYKEPWPWVIISIPAAAVIMGFVTLYLALANPDHLVVKDEEYRAIRSELRAQAPAEPSSAPESDPGAGEDGEH